LSAIIKSGNNQGETMFKNTTIYRYQIESALPPDFGNFQRFVPCGDLQEKSVGWIEPRGHNHGPMVEIVNGERIVKLMIETKSVPGKVLRDEVENRIYEIERTQGRKPGKKETRDIKEDARMALLPQAFPKQTTVLAWLRDDGLLIVDTASQSRADDFVSALMAAIPSLKLYLFSTVQDPKSMMMNWLLGDHYETPYGFSIGYDCLLESVGEDCAKVKFTHHNLDCDEVRRHVSEGKLPTALSLEFEGKAQFTLTDSMRIKKIDLLDAGAGEREEDAFDADVAIFTGTFGPLIDSLVKALGGEHETR
jgi:recombination associated protein RdgC